MFLQFAVFLNILFLIILFMIFLMSASWSVLFSISHGQAFSVVKLLIQESNRILLVDVALVNTIFFKLLNEPVCIFIKLMSFKNITI